MLTKNELVTRLRKLESIILEEPLQVLCVMSDRTEIIISVDEMIELGDSADFKRVVNGSSLTDLDKILNVIIGGTII